MSAQKYVICLAFLAVLLAINTVPAKGSIGGYAVNDKSHHMVIGSRMPGDKLAFRENIIKDSSWFRVVTVEKTYSVPLRESITMFQALDQKTNGNGAYASVLRGGPGQSNITVKFKSQRGHGINFIVEIYSR